MLHQCQRQAFDLHFIGDICLQHACWVIETRHVFVKHGCPRRQQSQNMANKSQILTLPHPQGHVMLVKCEEPLDELAVHFLLLYDHQTLNIAL